MGVKQPAPNPTRNPARALDAVVRELYGLSWNVARSRVRSGKVSVRGVVQTDPLFRVRDPADVSLSMNAPRPRAAKLHDQAIVYLDPHVVVEKPAGLSTIPYDDGENAPEEDTLDARVRTAIAARSDSRGQRPALGVVHRLDKETSGLVVFTRTWLAKQSLASQFRAHTVSRRYLAIACGDVDGRTIRSVLHANRGDGLRGTARRGAHGGGQIAVTHVKPVERLRGATLVECRLETGRTHQIRIHLSEAGHPIAGERVYVRDYAGDVIPAPRLMLHAAELGFIHPKTEAPMAWESAPPADFEATLARLRR